MKHVIRAIILIIILYVARNHYEYNDAVVNIVSVLLIIAFMYLVAAIIGAVRSAVINRRKTTVADNPAAQSSGCSGLFLIVLLFVLAYVFRAPLGMYSTRAFLITDNLLQLGSSLSPVVSWGLLGILIGSIYGSVVAWKKYKVNATVNLIPIGVFIIVLAILYLVNKPLESAAFEAVRNTQTTYAYDLVTAEVYNAPQDNNAMYKPSFLLDSSDKTAWITDVAKSNAEVRFSFNGLKDYRNKEVQCVGFVIKNGYRKSPQLWDNFARAKSIAIRHNGRFITAAIVNDKNSDSEEIKIAPVAISSFDNISVAVNTIYEGEKYRTRVAVTELVPIIEYEDN
jgi:hypothetical protein